MDGFHRAIIGKASANPNFIVTIRFTNTAVYLWNTAQAPPPQQGGDTFGGTFPIILLVLCNGADKSLAFPICSTNERIFLGWAEEVRTTKSLVCGAPNVHITELKNYFCGKCMTNGACLHIRNNIKAIA
jgi:hypothetical protein